MKAMAALFSSSRTFHLVCWLVFLSPTSLHSFSIVRRRTTTATTTRFSAAPKNSDVAVVRSMPDPLPPALKNTYYLLRHGQSTANVEGIISSARSLAYSDKHGLTPLGYEQGVASSQQLLSLLEGSSHERLVLISSPFARARQTAEACLEGLLAGPRPADLTIEAGVPLDERLMERYFGKLDDEAIYTYAYVWPVDQFNVTHTAFGVESVAAVATRLRELIVSLEDRYHDCHVVLVSHADVLQIAQLYAANVENVGVFSSYRFANGEVRVMKQTPDSLPEPNPLRAPKRGT
jgi:broad specificity phosphatase PhoE